MATVLVTDALQRKALVAVRSLGRAGHRVLVGEHMWPNTAFFSRHADGVALYPSPARDPAAFRRWLEDYLVRHGVDVLLPMDDATTEACLGGGLPCATALPTPEAFHLFRDKARTMEHARRRGVPVPPGASLAADPVAALKQARELGFPVVVKPRVGSGGRGLALARTPEEFTRVLAARDPGEPATLLQSWVGEGPQLDVCLLYDQGGRRVAAFVQREVRHYPLTGGPSTVQESVKAPELIALAERLVDGLGWVGPLEAEFRYDEAGEPRLMEVNPRFWASLFLAVLAGVDFPRLTVDVALGSRPSAPTDYPGGLRCRWLLPGDVLHYLTNPHRAQMDPPFWGARRRGVRDDMVAADDPLPMVGFFLAAAVYLTRPELRRQVLR